MKKKIKYYITFPKDRGEGCYNLVCETGEGFASHYCSSSGYAKNDLISGRKERQKELDKKHGKNGWEILWIGDDKLTDEELLKRNNDFYKNDRKQ